MRNPKESLRIIVPILLIIALALLPVSGALAATVPPPTLPPNTTVPPTIAGPSATANSEAKPTAKPTAKSAAKPTTKPNATAKPSIANTPSTPLGDAIASSGLAATAETDKSKCLIDIADPVNPYDVKYDYDENYNKIAAKCDWSKVFDAEYYIKEFPALAHLYNYDKDLLLKHFQTVGIREGRQGSESFNVKMYLESVPKSVRDALKDNYEGYYIYYMESGDKKIYPNEDDEYPTQLTIRPTAVQKDEIELINKARKENGVDDAAIYSELCAFANYRAYMDALNKMRAHDYIHTDDGIEDVSDVLTSMGVRHYSENTIKTAPNKMMRWFKTYATSKKHYDASIKDTNEYIGISNAYWSKDFKTVQFDIFIDAANAEMKIADDPSYIKDAA